MSFKVQVKTEGRIYHYDAIARYAVDVCDAAYDHFGVCAVTVTAVGAA